MMSALSTAQPAYGLEGPSTGRTVDNATPQSATYLRGNSVQSNGAGSKVNHYYDLRNSLVHQRASILITDEQVEDYRKTVERVLKKLFDVKFPV
jgi:hypothetical protein